MGLMGLLDRIKRVVSANLNYLVSKAEDPEKILDQVMEEMQEDLVQLRQGLAQTMAVQKRSEKQYNDALNEEKKWQNNAMIALQRGDEDLARQALQRKKTFSDTCATLKTTLSEQSVQVENIKRNLVQLEGKISEAKTKKELLKAKLTTAKAQQQLQGIVQGMNTSSAMAAFERMEEKVLMQEARAQAGVELAGADLESKFAQLEGSSDIDYQLAALKASMEQPKELPPSPTNNSSNYNDNKEDPDLEALRRKLDEL